MAKRLFFRNWLVLALLLVPTLMTAQEVTLRVDRVEYNVLVKFKAIQDRKKLEGMRKEAEEKAKTGQNKA